MNKDLIPLLSCPACHGKLCWTIHECNGDHIEEAKVRCEACAAVYPVHEGIGVFLTPDLPRHDLWEEAESELTTYLREHPDIERRLLETPPEELPPTDQFFLAMVLEERGDYAQARAAADLAHAGLYTKEYRACCKSQFDYVAELLSMTDDPIIDLASGRGYLVEELLGRLSRPIVGTDFSPRVLRRDRRLFRSLGLGGRVSLMAFDARRTPFKNGAVKIMTTNLGLPNIDEPGRLLDELRRVISGELLAIMYFFPEDDKVNKAMIEKLGLTPFMFKDAALERFAEAGFTVELENIQKGRALPTPTSDLLKGAGIDALPVAETELTWCTLVVR